MFASFFYIAGFKLILTNFTYGARLRVNIHVGHITKLVIFSLEGSTNPKEAEVEGLKQGNTRQLVTFGDYLILYPSFIFRRTVDARKINSLTW